MGALRLAYADFVRGFKNSKTLVIILLCVFFFYNEILSMRALAEQFGIGITLFVYPMFMTLSRGRMYALILVAMMMGEAPYYNGAEVFISMRISRFKWFVGKLIYILMLSATFQVVMMVVSVAVCAPYIGISNDWGDIIRTYITSIQGGVSVTGTVDSAYFLSLNPAMCMVQEFILMVLMSVIIALVIFLINGVFKNIMGTILVGIVVLIDGYLNDLSWWGIRDTQYIMPTTWVDINSFALCEGLSFEKCILYMLLMIVVLVVAGFILVGKKIIRPVKNI